MAAVINTETRLADIAELSGTRALAELNARGLEKIADIDGIDVAEVFAEIPPSERKTFYSILHKSNVAFAFGQSTSLDTMAPVLSNRTLKILTNANYHVLSDFSGTYYPDIYDLIGFSAGKQLLVFIRAAGLEVKFDSPEWDDADWKRFTEKLVDNGLVNWEDVAVNVLSELNPPQVGTAVANAVKHNYPPREAMKHVWEWLYSQNGVCEVSGKRIWLEVDHRIPKEIFVKNGLDPKEADTLENFQLLTKRENVIKRGSHRLGGLSFAQASAVLMYILFRFSPRTEKDFRTMCRNHGLTMADIRFSEAWAMAVWLSKSGLYEIEEE